MRVYHAPVTTKDRNSEVWTRWLKATGDALVQSNTAVMSTSNSKIAWVVSGITCTVVYHDPDGIDITDQTFTLPYTALMAFQANSIVYPAGTTSITIPAKTSFMQFQYVINLSNKIGVN